MLCPSLLSSPCTAFQKKKIKPGETAVRKAPAGIVLWGFGAGVCVCPRGGPGLGVLRVPCGPTRVKPLGRVFAMAMRSCTRHVLLWGCLRPPDGFSLGVGSAEGKRW